MAKYMYGVTKIEMGAVAGDGGMGTTLSDIGDVYKDTVEMSDDDPTITEHYSETKSSPVLTIEKAGKSQLKFSIMDMDPVNLIKFMGGSSATVSTFTEWRAPAALPAIEQSIKISTIDGGYIKIPRAKIVAKQNAKFGQSSMVLVDITASILQPTKSGEPARTYGVLT